MRGPVNTPISLTIVRKGMDDPFDVKVTRYIIRINAVKANNEKDVAYIKATTFNVSVTVHQSRERIENAKKTIGRYSEGLRHRCATTWAACSSRRSPSPTTSWSVAPSF